VIAPGSLSFRLLVGSALWIAIALVAGGVVLSSLFREHAHDRFDAGLAVHLTELAAALETDAGGSVRLSRPLSEPRFVRPFSGLYWQIDGPDGALLRSRSLWDSILPLPRDATADGALHRHRLRGPDGADLTVVERTVLPSEGRKFLRLAIAADAADLAKAVSAFDRVLAASFSVLALGLIVAAALQVGVGLAPLARLRRTLGAVREGRARHLEGPFPSEIQPLADDLNALLDHEAAVVERARTQVGNLAHAIKTPLAVIAGAVAGPAAVDRAQVAETIGTQVALAQKQVDYYLARARAAAASGVPGIRSEVAPVIDGLTRTLAQLYRDRGLAIEANVAPGLHFRGEEQDLQEIVGNVLDNACKWAAARVTVHAATDGNALVVAVDDDGPGLAPELRERVFTRGARADEAVPGSGLGLAIVSDLVRLYRGDVTLSESPLGGLRVMLRLPKAS
jgi:signal transduction histidine kinase